MNPHVLAIDLGTSAVKLALVSKDGRIAAFERRPLEFRILPDGGAEQDAEAWWTAISDGSRAVMASAALPPEGVGAVAISAQWAGTVPVDADGRPLCPAVIWMDSRGAPQVQRLVGGPLRVGGFGVDKLLAWIPRTGGLPQRAGKDPIAHILWLKEVRPEVYAAARWLLEPADWLGLRLTGRTATTPATIALHWLADVRDLSSVRYDPGLVRRSGIDPTKLPEIVPQGTVLGPLRKRSAEALGIAPGAVAVAGVPDVQAAAIGSGGVGDSEAHLCLGTSSWIGCHVPRKQTDVRRSMGSIPSGIPGRYLMVAAQETAGACVSWALDVLFGAPPERGASALDELAAQAPPGAGGVLFAPWLTGERAPVDDPDVRGAFLNVGLGTTRSHLARAVLEGVALNARWLLEGVDAFLGTPVPELRVIGGGARSALWCQIVADAFGRPILQVEDPLRSNALGAGFVGAAALGWIRFEDVPALVPVARRFEPDASHRPIYDRALAELVRAYRSTRSIGPRLAGARRGRTP